MDVKPVKIKLKEGYVDESGDRHQIVELGIGVNAGEYFLYETLWGDASPTGLTAYLIAGAITKFGTLKTPIATEIILSLKTPEFSKLASAFDKFTQQDGIPEKISHSTIRLIHGFVDKDGNKFDVAELGNITTGFDAVEVEKRGLSGIRAEALLAGRQIKKLLQSSGSEAIDGPLGYESINEMALIDVIGLTELAKEWNAMLELDATVRRGREKATGNRV